MTHLCERCGNSCHCGEQEKDCVGCSNDCHYSLLYRTIRAPRMNKEYDESDQRFFDDGTEVGAFRAWLRSRRS